MSRRDVGSQSHLNQICDEQTLGSHLQKSNALSDSRLGTEAGLKALPSGLQNNRSTTRKHGNQPMESSHFNSKAMNLAKCQDLLLSLQCRLAELSSQEDDNVLTNTIIESLQGLSHAHDIPACEIVPNIIERDWFDFMNKSTSDQCQYAIEVLVGEPDYRGERAAARAAKERLEVPGMASRSISETSDSRGEASCTDRAIPNRIRINSMLILKYLKTLDASIDETTALVMMRPFKLLIHHESAIRDTTMYLRRQGSVPGSPAPDAVTRDSDLCASEASIRDLDEVSMMESLQHMDVLEKFVDDYIKPSQVQIATNLNARVRFCDLWLLFKPGDDIHMPLNIQDTSINADGVGITPETFYNRYNKLWRITSISGGRQNIQAAQSRSADPRPNNFMVDCYYIDFHGRFFRPTVHTFEIAPFKGEVLITALKFYPARFLDAVPEQRTLDENLMKGRIVYERVAHSYTHFFYSGPTLMVHPCGCRLQNAPLIQEHIESEVIVDFKMALRKNPTWMPQREPWKVPVEYPEEVIENSKVKWWVDIEKRKKLQRTEIDQVYNDYAIDRERALIFQNEEPIFAPIPSGWTSNEMMVPDKDVKLLPGRVYAYILRTRKFSEFIPIINFPTA